MAEASTTWCCMSLIGSVPLFLFFLFQLSSVSVLKGGLSHLSEDTDVNELLALLPAAATVSQGLVLPLAGRNH